MTLDTMETAQRLGVALLLGGMLGFERAVHRKAAGVRTHMMVALGSSLLTILSVGLPDLIGRPDADPGRIVAQIVVGVGFLGTGAILRSGASVVGLTTAASLWLASAIGMAVGLGFNSGAVIATLFGLLVLLGEHLTHRFSSQSGDEAQKGSE